MKLLSRFLVLIALVAVPIGLAVAARSTAPDGQHLAFTTTSPPASGTISIAPIDGTAAHAVIDGGTFVWTATGALVAFHGTSSPPYSFQNGYYVFSP